MDAIVYRSNTGFTKRYALMLSDILGIDAIPYKSATKSLDRSSSIIYMGWIMGGNVSGYKKISQKFNVEILIGVGVNPAVAQTKEMRINMLLEENFPLFVLQGGLDTNGQKWFLRMMLKMASKQISRQLSSKKDLNSQETELIRAFQTGKADYVDENNLKVVVDFIRNKEKVSL